MKEHILFLTGKLARKSLERVMKSIKAEEFSYEIHTLPITVAALVTTDMILRQLDRGENVELQSFGSFSVREYAVSIGRHSKTGEKTNVKAKNFVKR